MNKWVLIVGFCCLFFACEKFKKTSLKNSAALVWTQSDEAPSFSVCDSLETSTDRYRCFQEKLNRMLTSQIRQHKLSPENPLNDTLTVTLLIDQQGKISVKKMISSPRIDAEFPHIDSVLRLSVSKLPMVLPATKTNLASRVKSTIDLPIIFKTPPQ